MEYYKQTIESLLGGYHSSRSNGLSYRQVRANQKRYGINELTLKEKSWWRKALEPFFNIFVIILLVAVLISVVAGEYLDGTIVGVVIAINAIIYWVQQYSTERVLRALKKHSQQIVSVRRQGKITEIGAAELVPGDIIQLTEGQKVPADCRILEAESVAVNESVLTGETVPMHKHSAHISIDTPIYKQHNMLFQGTFVTSGTVEALVVAVGGATEFGRLAKLAEPNQLAPLQQKIDHLVKLIIKIIAGVSLAVFVLGVIRGMPLNEVLHFMLTMAVSAVPEGLPIALTIILVIAMRKMATQHALVRSMHAIENLGLITVIATDKTGTLTKNILSVQDAWPATHVSEAQLKMYVRLSACVHDGNQAHDPLDLAMDTFGKRAPLPKELTYVRQFSFVQELRMSGVLWQKGKHYELYVKGAPEHLLRLCGLSKEQLKEAESTLHQFTSNGQRVIGLATATFHLPIKKLEAFKGAFKFRGFIAVADSLRKEAAGAIASAQAAGINVKMITGDHYETAFHIGKTLGLAQHPKEVFNAEQYRKHVSLPAQVVNSHSVFARILPEDKLRILKSLKRTQITAMTGDGVNDVPALASAHVGVAMGSGSDIAKEAGDIVLLDDNFKTIISAIREGRIVFANIRKMLFYLFSTTLGEILTMLGALLVGLPLPVTAIQILWINLVTDTLMVLPLGLDPPEGDVMKHEPRKPRAPLLDKKMITRLIIMGITLASVTLLVFAFNVKQHSLVYAQGIAFTMLVVGQWAKALVARSETQSVFVRIFTPNYPQLIGLVVAASLQALVIFGPLGKVFELPNLAWSDVWQPILLITIVVLVVGELHKLFTRNTKVS